jgi:NAD(P)-dependent dehydrogenase (short-subunit alcohol dehydrogenase family)
LEVVVDTPFIGSVTRNENPQAKELSKMLAAGTPWGTLAQVEDVARAAVFFVSEDAQFLTGLPLAIDGGYTAR